MKKFLKNLLAYSLPALILVIIIEVLLRLFAPQIQHHDGLFQADEHLGWSFVPSNSSSAVYPNEVNQIITINPQGFRDADFDLTTASKKIMVIGDSFVSNIAVDDDAVFTEMMEATMENTTVMNFGVNGFGQVQELLLLEKWAPQIQADLIVQMVYLRNDFKDNVKADNWLYPKPTAQIDSDNEIIIVAAPKDAIAHVAKKQKDKELLERVHLYHFVRSRIGNIRAKKDEKTTKFKPPEIDICARYLTQEVQTQYKVLQQLLLKTKERAEAMDTPIVFVLAPSIGQVQDVSWETIIAYDATIELERSLPNTRLLHFAKENDLQMLDLLPMLREANTEETLLYNQFEQHWTARGNAIVAQAILEFLSEDIQY